VIGTDYVGGLVGINGYYDEYNCGGGEISECYSVCTVTGGRKVGGMVGYNIGMIKNCYSAGSASGEESIGGLVGDNAFYTPPEAECWPPGCHCVGAISYCYSASDIYANIGGGGLVGVGGGSVYLSLWDTETSGQATSAGGTPKTTAEMKTMSTFTDANWDFVEIWGIGENQTYPFLRTDPAGDSNHDKKVDLIDLAILASHWLEGP